MGRVGPPATTISGGRLRLAANSAIDRCAFVLAACGLAAAAAVALDILYPPASIAPLCAAAMLAGRLGGLGPGFAAAVLGWAAWALLVLAPTAPPPNTATAWAGLAGGNQLVAAAVGALARRLSGPRRPDEDHVEDSHRRFPSRTEAGPAPAPAGGPLSRAGGADLVPRAPARPDGPPSTAGILAAALADRAALAAELGAARRAGAEARALYERLFAAVPEALLLVGEDGRYLDANPAAAALLGYGREELVGMRIGDIPAVGGVWTDLERARFVRDGEWTGRMAMRRRDGAPLAVEVRAVAVLLPSGTAYFAALAERSRGTIDQLRGGLRRVPGGGPGP